MSCLKAGKDATDDFEDVGHSGAARSMMNEYYVGDVDPASLPSKPTYIPAKQATYNSDKSPDFLIKILQFLVPLAILGLAVAVRFLTKNNDVSIWWSIAFLCRLPHPSIEGSAANWAQMWSTLIAKDIDNYYSAISSHTYSYSTMQMLAWFQLPCLIHWRDRDVW